MKNIGNGKALDALKTTQTIKPLSPLDALKGKSSASTTPPKSIPETTAKALETLKRVSTQATTDLTPEEQAMVDELLKGGRNMTGKMEVNPDVVEQERKIFEALRKQEIIDELLEKIDNLKENPKAPKNKKPLTADDFEI
jgi:hypothetical protein